MKSRYPELDLILEKVKLQKMIYQPTAFWKNAAMKIVKDISEEGIENFRRLKTPLTYFVPNYGIPTNSFTKETKDFIQDYIQKNGTKKQAFAMEEFLSGYFHALADYRVFLASEDTSKKPILNTFSESSFGNPIEQFEFDGKKYSRSALNYILGLSLLKKHLKPNDEIKTVLEIGGGFGTLGEILSFTKDIKYINVDIPPTSFVSWNYLQNIFGSAHIEPYIRQDEPIIVENLKVCSVLNSWDIEKIEGKIDLFVNFISFQEMEPPVVKNYLNHVTALHPKWILLRNIREGKQIKKTPNGMGVEIPILKEDYIKMIADKYELLEANVFPFGYKTVDSFHSELLLFKRK